MRLLRTAGACLLMVGAIPVGVSAQGLHAAAAEGDLDKVKALVLKGESVNAVDEDGNTPLHHASANCRVVLRPSTDKSPVTGGDGTVYRRTEQVSEGFLDVVTFLVEKGADINAKNKKGSTPLHHSAQMGTLDVAKFLVARGAALDVKDAAGMTPLDWARMNVQGRTKDVAAFLEGLAAPKKK